jgi:hypothetical protein
MGAMISDYLVTVWHPVWAAGRLRRAEMGMCKVKFPFKDLIISAIKSGECLEFVFECQSSREIRGS